jgi:hypothetical protein
MNTVSSAFQPAPASLLAARNVSLEILRLQRLNLVLSAASRQQAPAAAALMLTPSAMGVDQDTLHHHWMQHHGTMGVPQRAGNPNIIQYVHQQQALHREYTSHHESVNNRAWSGLTSPPRSTSRELLLSNATGILPAVLSHATDEAVLTKFQVYLR